CFAFEQVLIASVGQVGGVAAGRSWASHPKTPAAQSGRESTRVRPCAAYQNFRFFASILGVGNAPFLSE
ncbi:MAG: hypothetical protein ACNA8H_15105, partial [Anaerolineales bacterium]